MAAEWIKQIGAEERKRDAARLREAEATAHQAEMVRVQGRQLVDGLRTTVARDIEAFRQEFADCRPREIVFEDIQPDGGFLVGKPEHPAVTLSVVPHLGAGTVCCRYLFTPNNGLPAREFCVDLRFVGTADDTLQFKHHASGQVFATPDGLSEYLLSPVFTGRPR